MSEIPIGTLCLVRCPVCSARVGGTAVVTGALQTRPGLALLFGTPIRVEWKCYEIEGRTGSTQCAPSCITPITPPPADELEVVGDELEVAALLADDPAGSELLALLPSLAASLECDGAHDEQADSERGGYRIRPAGLRLLRHVHQQQQRVGAKHHAADHAGDAAAYAAFPSDVTHCVLRLPLIEEPVEHAFDEPADHDTDERSNVHASPQPGRNLKSDGLSIRPAVRGSRHIDGDA